MKIKYIFYFIYIFIILMIPVSLINYSSTSRSFKVTDNVIALNSSSIGTNNVQLKVNEDINDDNESTPMIDTTSLNITETNNSSEILNEITDSLIPKVNYAEGSFSNVLETQYGKLTAYGPDCPGCGGKVGYGQDVRNGNIYFTDSTYGQLRILAGDKKYPYGTIVKISNSNMGSPFYGIVLDRGGSVGIGKATMFDLLFASTSEASNFGTSRNCTFEILRYGF